MDNRQDSERQQRLRKVAILIASLDRELAQPMLAGLPPRDREDVRQAIDQLGDVARSEQSDVAANFQQEVAASLLDQCPTDEQVPSLRSQGVELDSSLLACIESGELAELDVDSSKRKKLSPALATADAETLADLLAREHPQTIALVISRIEHSQASEVLDRFSLTLQSEVLVRLANLDAIDPQTVDVIESQLATWLADNRQQQQRMAAGTALVRQFVESAPQNRQKAILTSLTSKHPALGERLKQTLGCDSNSSLYSEERAVNQHAPEKPKTPILPPKETRNQRDQLPPAPPELLDLASELDSASDAILLAALSQTDRRTAMLALAGSEEPVLSRFLRRLPWRQARAFRRQLRNFGPTRLGDMLEAQQTLARTVRQLAHS